MKKNIVTTALILIASGIILGAFGAHSLKQMVDEARVQSFETGVRYQVWMGLGLLGLAALMDLFSEKGLRRTFVFLLIGIALFSGSIYGLTISYVSDLPAIRKVLGPITPIGGLFLITAWINAIFSLKNSVK